MENPVEPSGQEAAREGRPGRWRRRCAAEVAQRVGGFEQVEGSEPGAEARDNLGIAAGATPASNTRRPSRSPFDHPVTC